MFSASSHKSTCMTLFLLVLAQLRGTWLSLGDGQEQPWTLSMSAQRINSPSDFTIEVHTSGSTVHCSLRDLSNLNFTHPLCVMTQLDVSWKKNKHTSRKQDSRMLLVRISIRNSHFRVITTSDTSVVITYVFLEKRKHLLYWILQAGLPMWITGC